MTDTTNNAIKENFYFANRNVTGDLYTGYKLPRYLASYFTENDKDIHILDIGCGLGQLLNNLKEQGFKNLYGIDINEESILACRNNGLIVEKINDIRVFASQSKQKFDRIVMSHVLEHIDKDAIIETLAHIKTHLLKEGGVFLLMVPNAQSYTGSYWRYEDFTHTIMFTAGSCIYVLKSAGFTNIEFIDPDGTKHMNPVKKAIIKILVGYHKIKEHTWNKILQTSFHKTSPKIYTFELKVAAR